jgi:hypothetical protein
MKVLLREIEGEETANSKARLLTFKEFCQYVYEPSKRIKSLNLPEEQRHELEEAIERRRKR